MGASGMFVSPCVFLFLVRLPLTGGNMRSLTCWPCFAPSRLSAAWQPNCTEGCHIMRHDGGSRADRADALPSARKT